MGYKLLIKTLGFSGRCSEVKIASRTESREISMVKNDLGYIYFNKRQVCFKTNIFQTTSGSRFYGQFFNSTLFRRSHTHFKQDWEKRNSLLHQVELWFVQADEFL